MPFECPVCTVDGSGRAGCHRRPPEVVPPASSQRVRYFRPTFEFFSGGHFQVQNPVSFKTIFIDRTQLLKLQIWRQQFSLFRTTNGIRELRAIESQPTKSKANSLHVVAISQVRDINQRNYS